MRIIKLHFRLSMTVRTPRDPAETLIIVGNWRLKDDTRYARYITKKNIQDTIERVQGCPTKTIGFLNKPKQL